MKHLKIVSDAIHNQLSISSRRFGWKELTRQSVITNRILIILTYSSRVVNRSKKWVPFLLHSVIFWEKRHCVCSNSMLALLCLYIRTGVWLRSSNIWKNLEQKSAQVFGTIPFLKKFSQRICICFTPKFSGSPCFDIRWRYSLLCIFLNSKT